MKHKDQFSKGLFSYNFGTMQLKQGQFAIGRFHLEKAIKNGFINRQVFKNLAAAKSNLEGTKNEKPTGFLDLSFYQLVDTPHDVFLGLALGLVLFALIIKKIKLIKSTYFLIGLLTIASGIWATSVWMHTHYSFAVTFKKSNILEGPSAIFEKSYEIPAGVKVIVSKPKEGWYYIKSPLGYSGWIDGKDIGVI